MEVFAGCNSSVSSYQRSVARGTRVRGAVCVHQSGPLHEVFIFIQRFPSNNTNSISFSILFLHRDRFLSNLKPHSDVFHDTNDDAQGEPDTIKQLFEVAQQIGSILSALDASGAPVISPYSGFSVFVAAHINMYGTIAPQRYPGGLKRAEEEKTRNLVYLERLSKLWPVGRSWVSISNPFSNQISQLTNQVAHGPRSKSILRDSQE